MRALLFGVTGIALFAYWAIAHPSTELTASITEWPNVLWFSATLMLLAVAVAAFGRMVGGRTVVRTASLAAAGIAMSSVANVLEDGFRIEPAFYGFILGTLIHVVGMAALVVAILVGSRARERLVLVLIPAGSAAGILLFVVAGGPILLVTWLLAGGWAIAHGRAALHAEAVRGAAV